MENFFFTALFLVIPIASLALCLINDEDQKRKRLINTLLMINVLIYFAPLFIAFIGSFPNGNMWNENGSGAFLWFYLLVIPFCGAAFIVFLILKIIYRSGKKPAS